MRKSSPIVPAQGAPASPASPGSRRLPILLRRAWHGLNQAFRRRIAHTGCTPDQYIVLRNLAEAGPPGLTQAALTRSMSSDPNTVAALISRMVRSGLVDRRRHATDGRSRQIHLKPLGRRRFNQVFGMARLLEDEVLSELQSVDQQEFLKRLEGVADRCQVAARH